MCTAYEIGATGKTNRPFPAWFAKKSISELLGLDVVQFLRPTLVAPIMLPEGALQPMRWGFQRRVPGATKVLHKPIVNAREDQLSGRTWAKAMSERRCLIPASAYYEWSGPAGAKRTHRFTRPDRDWIWIAGLWEDSQEFGRCFAMITTEPNEIAAAVHDRMPAVLRDEELASFLEGHLRTFKPAIETLAVSDAPNPLRKNLKPRGDGEQLDFY